MKTTEEPEAYSARGGNGLQLTNPKKAALCDMPQAKRRNVF